MLSTADIDLKVKSLGTFQGLPESPIHGLNFRNVTFRLESDEESQKPPKSKGWDCSGCYGAMYASGTAEGLTPPLDGKCMLSPPPAPGPSVPLKSDDVAAAW